MCKRIRTGLKDYNDALNRMATGMVDLNMAKLNLIRTYSTTILDAKKKFGKGADKLFPVIHSTPSVDDKEYVTEEEDVPETV